MVRVKNNIDNEWMAVGRAMMAINLRLWFEMICYEAIASPVHHVASVFVKIHFRPIKISYCYVSTRWILGVLIKFAFRIYRWSQFTFELEQQSNGQKRQKCIDVFCLRSDRLSRIWIAVDVSPYANTLEPCWVLWCTAHLQKISHLVSPAHHILADALAALMPNQLQIMYSVRLLPCFFALLSLSCLFSRFFLC